MVSESNWFPMPVKSGGGTGYNSSSSDFGKKFLPLDRSGGKYKGNQREMRRRWLQQGICLHKRS